MNEDASSQLYDSLIEEDVEKMSANLHRTMPWRKIRRDHGQPLP